MQKQNYKNLLTGRKTFANYLLYITLSSSLLAVSCDDATTESAEDEIDTVAQKIESAVDDLKEEYVEYRNDMFVKNSHENNADELYLLSLAMRKATDNEMKKQAQKMHEEHKKLKDDLRTYALKNDISIDEEYEPDNLVLNNQNTGTEWDKVWLDDIINEHEKMINKFDNASSRTTDKDLQELVNKYLPVLKSHLDDIRKLQNKIAIK